MTSIDIKLYSLANTLLLLSGDVEMNPGPRGREPKPDPKKIMEDKVNSHDEKIKLLEQMIEEQKKLMEEMSGKQVELEGQISSNKVELERAAEENKVLEERVGQLQVKLVESGETQVDLEARVQANQEDFDKRLVETNTELETTRREKGDLETRVSELQVSLANAHNAQVDLEATVTANQKSTDEAVAEIREDISKIQDGLKGGLSQLGSQTSGTDNKLRALENSLDEVQDKLWELDKSWENNLVFYGIRKLEETGQEETSTIMEIKIREIVKNRLGIGRIYLGSNVRGSKPVTVYFQKYADKEEILRKAKLLAGSNIYVTEDFSKRVKDKRIELQKFMKKLKKKQPASRFHLRYDKLLVDKDVYVFNENTGLVELQPSKSDEYDMSRSSPTTPFRSLRGKSSSRKKLEKSFSTDSALNHLGGSISDLDSRDPSPTKSMTPPLEEHIEMYLDGKSRPASPKDEQRTDGESEDESGQSAAAANYTNLNTFNGNLRKSNPDIPETIAEDE